MEDFDDYVRTRGRALWRAAFLLTGDAHEAEDLVQAALAKTYLRFDELGERYDAYLRTTMYRTYCSWWRRLWRGERPTERLPETPSADPAAESRVDSLRALEELPPRQRAVIVLRFFEDRSVADVAELLGVSEGTVKSSTNRGCAALRTSLHLTEAEPQP